MAVKSKYESWTMLKQWFGMGDVRIVRRLNRSTGDEVVERYDGYTGEYRTIAYLAPSMTTPMEANIAFMREILKETGELNKIYSYTLD